MRRAAVWVTAALAFATSGSAQAQSLGARFSSVRQAYSQAQNVTVGKARALELHDVDFGGFHWKVVDFVFDSVGRLDHLTMSSDEVAYDAVLQAASVRPDEPTGLSTAVASGAPEVQIRVCEQRGGGVTVTYEALSTIS